MSYLSRQTNSNTNAQCVWSNTDPTQCVSCNMTRLPLITIYQSGMPHQSPMITCLFVLFLYQICHSNRNLTHASIKQLADLVHSCVYFLSVNTVAFPPWIICMHDAFNNSLDTWSLISKTSLPRIMTCMKTYNTTSFFFFHSQTNSELHCIIFLIGTDQHHCKILENEMTLLVQRLWEHLI